MENRQIFTRNIFHQCHCKFLHIPLFYTANINIHFEVIRICYYFCNLFISTGNNWYYFRKWSIILQQIKLASFIDQIIKSCFFLHWLWYNTLHILFRINFSIVCCYIHLSSWYMKYSVWLFLFSVIKICNSI